VIRSKKLRDSARGEECTLQIHPYCEGQSETVVLCHLASEGHGIGLKSHDYWSAYGCATCHAIIDGRDQKAFKAIGHEEIERCRVRGLYRTWDRMIASGLITIKGAA
jgi:hypothetical protein